MSSQPGTRVTAKLECGGPTPAGSQWHGVCRGQQGRWGMVRPGISQAGLPLKCLITLTFNDTWKFNVSLRVCQWENQARKAGVVFNETPALLLSEINTIHARRPFSVLGLPLWGKTRQACRDGVGGQGEGEKAPELGGWERGDRRRFVLAGGGLNSNAKRSEGFTHDRGGYCLCKRKLLIIKQFTTGWCPQKAFLEYLMNFHTKHLFYRVSSINTYQTGLVWDPLT